MLHSMSPYPCDDDWQGSAFWKAGVDTHSIFIPLEDKISQTITAFVLLDDHDFPEDGQNTLYDYAGGCFRETSASLTIHRELDQPALEGGYTLTLLKLAQSIDQCNIHSRNHAIRTAFWATQIASHLGLEQLDQIELAGKLHDVGKVVVPKSVLGKPGRLTEAEWQIVRRHPTFGALILQPSAALQPLAALILAHHERFDGSGYPSHLVGEQIPLAARIIAVADAFTTMTEGRVYRPASTRLQAVAELERCSGKQFDPTAARVLVDLVQANQVDDSACCW